MLNLELLILITDRDECEPYVELFQKHYLPLTLAVLAQGTASQEILDMFSLEETEKVVLFSAGISEKIHCTLKEIHKNSIKHSTGPGIAMAIPLSSVGGRFTAHYLTEEHAVERKEYPMVTDESFELIIAIINEGYSTLVMDAARDKGGAMGGTVIHARGLGTVPTQKFFGISISEEKEIIFIACTARTRNKIMQAIIEHAGITTKARSVVFSVPVSSAAGLGALRALEEAEEEA